MQIGAAVTARSEQEQELTNSRCSNKVGMFTFEFLKISPLPSSPRRAVQTRASSPGFPSNPDQPQDTNNLAAMSAGNADFETLLAELLSHHNDARRNAESVYNQNLETQPDTTVQQLLRCLENGQVTPSLVSPLL